MNPEVAALLARLLRRVGGATALLGALAVVALRLAAPSLTGDTLASLGANVLLASAAMVAALIAAMGMALLVAGLAMGADAPPARRPLRASAREEG